MMAEVASWREVCSSVLHNYIRGSVKDSLC